MSEGYKSDLDPAAFEHLIFRIAQALARSDGEEEAASFEAHRRTPPADGDSEYEFYMATIREVLGRARLSEQLRLFADAAMIEGSDRLGRSDTLERIEAYAAAHEIDIIDIAAQIERSRTRDSLDRGDDWLRSASRALAAKRRNLGFALRLRLQIMRRAGPMGQQDAAWDAEVGPTGPSSGAQAARDREFERIERENVSLKTQLDQMRASRDKEREKRTRQLSRLNLSRGVLLARMRIFAPELVDEAMEHVSRLQAEHDADPSGDPERFAELKEWTEACIAARETEGT
ncbi:hypothetical protein [Paracoccus sp. ME4]|uniref:hypothetical protein n=1 Tax=Paracoccus sp. ME4 TaxID=3138066 RepID=UPI00398A79C5